MNLGTHKNMYLQEINLSIALSQWNILSHSLYSRVVLSTTRITYQSLEAIVETFEFVENIVASNINDSLGTLRQAVLLQRLPGYLLGPTRAWIPAKKYLGQRIFNTELIN